MPYLAGFKSILKDREQFKKILVFILLVVLTLLAYRFIARQKWQLKIFADNVRKVMTAPGAVNLTLAQQGDVFFAKSFPFNPQAEYYIVRVPAVIKILARRAFTVRCNREPEVKYRLLEQPGFSVLIVGRAKFIFISSSDFTIVSKSTNI